MTTYYERQRRRHIARLKAGERRRRAEDWLDRAASVDQIIGYALIAIVICALFVLVLEMAR